MNHKKLGEIISRLRVDKGISQESLALALNIPRPSVSQIEKGARDISFAELNKILEVFQISYDDFITLLNKSAQKESSSSPKKTKNKKISYLPEKFQQLFLYILQKCGSKPNVGETVIYKILYFCDFDFFELYEKPLSGMRYKKLQYGPVPDQSLFNPLINDLIKKGNIERINRPYAGDTIQTKYISFVEANMSQFSPEELQIIDKTINRLSDMSARQIEDHVHGDYPWKSHNDGEEIDYSSVFNRTGEFAQRDYETEFMQASAQDAMEHLPSLTKEEYDYYMALPDKK